MAWNISLKDGWVSQKASNLNGCFRWVPMLCHCREIGQWSKPSKGRIQAERSPPRWIALSERRNRSSFEAICRPPDCLLFHVYMPFEKGMWMSHLFLMKSLKWEHSGSNLDRPPIFPSSLVIILKSPPRIQRGWVGLEFKASIVFRSAILLVGSWGKYTFDKFP